jgi:hypothetical protein
MRIDRRVAEMRAHRGWGEEVLECAVRRFPSYAQLLAFEEAYLVVEAEDTRADQAVAGSPEEVAGTDPAAAGLAEGTDRAVAVTAVGCGAVAVRRHLLKR